MAEQITMGLCFQHVLVVEIVGELRRTDMLGHGVAKKLEKGKRCRLPNEN